MWTILLNLFTFHDLAVVYIESISIFSPSHQIVILTMTMPIVSLNQLWQTYNYRRGTDVSKPFPGMLDGVSLWSMESCPSDYKFYLKLPNRVETLTNVVIPDKEVILKLRGIKGKIQQWWIRFFYMSDLSRWIEIILRRNYNSRAYKTTWKEIT